jgi:LysR family transcriptional regulator, low CO2-responsive transcriptional regulator
MNTDGLGLDQLRAFDRVVREGSFSRAALALDIGQPAVSTRIRGLEAAVGGALFTRGRRVALTPRGESLLPYVRRALEVLGEGLAVARAAVPGQKGRVSLGVLGSLAGGLVGPALARFMRASPEVECTIRSGFHEVLVDMLLDGLVEMALVAWPFPKAAAADLTPLLVLNETVTLLVAPRHALAGRRAVSEADVARLARPFFRLRWWPEHHPALERLAAATATAVDVAMEPALHLVQQGVGAGFFPDVYTAGVRERGTVVPVAVRGLPRIERGSALVRRATGPLSPCAANLVQAIRGEARRLGLAPRMPRGATPSRRA